MANIGDAQLVSSNVVSINEINSNTTSSDTTTNDTEESKAPSNEVLNNSGTIATSNNTVQSKNDYFSTSKLERDTMYSQMLETYENILNSNNSLETQKQSATEEIKKINDTKNSIMICENLIKTKGFENVIVFVNGESVSIVVKDEQLNTEKVAQIQNIISREMNAKVENIHISSK